VTVTQGTNRLVGCNPQRIVAGALEALDNESTGEQVPELWDGRAAERVVSVIMG
jgi:UDP-N-acetylglucosamine 2-epimerase (non-hydrolysing)